MIEFMKLCFDFASESPATAVLVTLIVSVAVVYLTAALFVTLPSRCLRHLNIRSRGWPPEHLDGDGDYQGSDED